MFVTLIPKIDNPSGPNHYQHINTFYKIISKILVNLLRPVLQSIISPLHRAFIPDRCIHDNMLITSEIRHMFRTSRSHTRWFVLKLDMEKAYNHIE